MTSGFNRILDFTQFLDDLSRIPAEMEQRTCSIELLLLALVLIGSACAELASVASYTVPGFMKKASMAVENMRVRT